ncbi:protein sneaky-like [Haliotis cracherodii]|uniref:protein sneaky-like n=1 Tax=Haliotis cracherodii TaxID=6455 RepID=UPI0039EA8266
MNGLRRFSRKTEGRAVVYRVKHQYNPTKQDELRLGIGDEITDIKDVGNGWVVGYNKTTGNTGLCPKDYLQKGIAGRGQSRVDRFRNRVSTIYVNLTQQNASGSYDFHIPPPPTEVLSPENTKEDSKTNSKNYILPNTHTHGQKCTRAVIGILVGLFLGCVMFAALSLAYHYSFVESAAISGGITLVMCVFLVISPHARCVAALMSVSVFTGQGRTAFLSLIPGLLLAGPVTNIHRNFNETATSVACIAEVVLNQSLALHHQLLEPIAKQQRSLDKAAEVVERKTSAIRLALTSFRSEIKDIEETVVDPNSSKGCAGQLQFLYTDCESAVQDSIEACKASTGTRARRNSGTPTGPYNDPNYSQGQPKPLPLRRRKCDPSLCDSVKSKPICDPLKESSICKWANDTVIKSSARAVTERYDEMDELLSFSINSSSVIDVRGNTSSDPIQSVRELKKRLQEQLDLAVFIFKILNRILIIFLLSAFIKASLYVRRYLRYLKFDNIYLRDQIKYLDKHIRAEDESKALFPLKDVEKRKYIDSTSMKLSRSESLTWMMGFTQVILHIFLSAMVILVDYGLYYVLTILQRNGDVDFLVTGGVWLQVNVSGSGPFADIFRTVVEGISVSKSFEDVLNFKRCLPSPTEQPRKILYFIISLYSLVLVFVLLQAYGLRLRHKMVAFFFPEREAERIHYLYRHILNKRRLRASESRKLNLLKDQWSVIGLEHSNEKTSTC